MFKLVNVLATALGCIEATKLTWVPDKCFLGKLQVEMTGYEHWD